MKETNEYEHDLQIDPNALDVEWLKQASMFFKYSEKAAQARKSLDEKKEEYDVYRSSLNLKVRKGPESFGLQKVTEASIDSVLVSDKTIIQFEEEINDLKYELDIINGAVRAFDQKKTALENLVKLLGMEYFSGPNAPRDLGKEWEKKVKHTTANHKVREGLKKGK